MERSDYFYKALPSVVNADTLAAFGVSVAKYTESFNKIDSCLICKENTFHPKIQRLTAQTLKWHNRRHLLSERMTCPTLEGISFLVARNSVSSLVTGRYGVT